MTRINQSIRIVALAGLVAAVATAVQAQEATRQQDAARLPLMITSDTQFITGGVGREEEEAIRALASDYNLSITNANPRGEYAVGAAIMVQGKNGEQKINLTNVGPKLYAKLPPGQYKVKASNGDEYREKTVTVPARGMKDLNLIWNQG